MIDSPEKQTFGDYLRYFRGQTVDRNTGKPLSQELFGIHLTDKVGKVITRNKVNHWETDRNSPHPQRERNHLIYIVAVLKKYKGIKTLNEANQLLHAGNYLPLTRQEIDQIDPAWNEVVRSEKAVVDSVAKTLPSSSSDPSNSEPLHRLNNQIPGKSYRELIGRNQLLGEIMAALRDPIGKWIVAIDGMGGIGKTALAQEIADRCGSERLFDAVVWEQAPKEMPSLPTANGTEVGTLTFEAVLDSIARQLGAMDVPRLKGLEKELRIKALLQLQRVLVVLDNMETSKEPQNEIARRLLPLLNPSKALMTSRHRFQGEIFSVHIPGLDEYEALKFIRQEAEEKNIGSVSQADVSELKQIAETTGGSPLALKLVVGQLGYLPLKTVLGQLRKIKIPKGDSDKSDYVRFYKGIFSPSWKLLSDDGKKLLISMSHFAPGIGGTHEAVKATSDLDDEVLTNCISELWRLSFLERGESPTLQKIRYYLHALTRYFVLSDIVKVL